MMTVSVSALRYLELATVPHSQSTVRGPGYHPKKQGEKRREEKRTVKEMPRVKEQAKARTEENAYGKKDVR